MKKIILRKKDYTQEHWDNLKDTLNAEHSYWIPQETTIALASDIMDYSRQYKVDPNSFQEIEDTTITSDTIILYF